MGHGHVESGRGIAPKGCGHFFIVRTTWYQGRRFEDEFDYHYLHTDGQWRDSLYNESNEPTGWHTSKEVAQQLLAQAP